LRARIVGGAISTLRWHGKRIAPLPDMKTVSRHPRVLCTSTLKGDLVCSAAGKDLGMIEEFMIDPETGRVTFAVLSFGGYLGLGDGFFAVPWEAMSRDAERHEFRLHVDTDRLKDAPRFDSESWPDPGDRSWESDIYRHYGYRPYWE